MSDQGLIVKAINLADNGFFVFPLFGKQPLSGFRWKERATRDPKEIAADFAGSRATGIGIACGPSGVIVIDADKYGEFERLCWTEHQAVPDTMRVRTAHGMHWYFRTPPGWNHGNAKGGLRDWALDVRGDGGYVAGPGSEHPDAGVLYEQITGTHVELLPDWLRALLETKPTNGDPFARAGFALPDQIPEGQRHDTIMRYAAHLRGIGVPWPDAELAVESAWARCAQAGFRWPMDEALLLAKDVYQRYPDGGKERVVPEPDDDDGYRTALAREVTRLRLARDAHRLIDAESAPTGEELDAQYLDAAELAKLVANDHLIDGVLPADSIGLLRGRDSSYKTFVALGWSLAVATGRPWLSHKVTAGPVLYIVGEGVYGASARVQAWLAAWNGGEQPAPGQFTIRRSAVNFYRGGPGFEHLLNLVSEGGYVLVVVDTLRTASGGADGNGSDMAVVVDNFTRLREATNRGTVLVVSHTGKADEDTRGYSGVEDDADFVWHCKADAGEVDVRLAKMKDGPDGSVLRLRPNHAWGAPVMEYRGGSTPDLAASKDQAVLTALAEYPTGGATARMLVDGEVASSATVHRALGRLERRGFIVGTPSHGSTRWRLTGTGQAFVDPA